MAEAKEIKGTKWLAEYVNEELGTSYTGYQLRILLRKLVKDEVIEREEGNYQFKGERDPRVRAVLKAIKGGALEAEKKERVTKARTKKAAADEGAEEKPVRRSRAKKADPVEETEEEEAPKPARRSRAKKVADEEPEAPKPTRRSRAKKAEPVEEDDDLDLDEI